MTFGRQQLENFRLEGYSRGGCLRDGGPKGDLRATKGDFVGGMSDGVAFKFSDVAEGTKALKQLERLRIGTVSQSDWTYSSRVKRFGAGRAREAAKRLGAGR